MIEIIRTYQGYTRPEGRIKQTFAHMYRCSKCEEITNTIQELRQTGCTHEFARKREHVPSSKRTTLTGD